MRDNSCMINKSKEVSIYNPCVFVCEDDLLFYIKADTIKFSRKSTTVQDPKKIIEYNLNVNSINREYEPAKETLIPYGLNNIYSIISGQNTEEIIKTTLKKIGKEEALKSLTSLL